MTYLTNNWSVVACRYVAAGRLLWDFPSNSWGCNHRHRVMGTFHEVGHSDGLRCQVTVTWRLVARQCPEKRKKRRPLLSNSSPNKLVSRVTIALRHRSESVRQWTNYWGPDVAGRSRKLRPKIVREHRRKVKSSVGRRDQATATEACNELRGTSVSSSDLWRGYWR
jgi:hypothetical protein